VDRAASHRVITRTFDAPEFGGQTRLRDIWDVGRELRNQFAHPKRQIVVPYVMALPILAPSHRLVAELFPAS
jgi:hypothetical protein